MKKCITILTSIAAALALTGCSAGGFNSTDKGMTGGAGDVSLSGSTGSIGGAGSSGALGGSGGSDGSDGSSSPDSVGGSDEFSGTDIGGKKDSILNKIGDMFEEGVKDAAEADGEYFDEAAPAEIAGEDCYIPERPYPEVPEIPPQSGLLTGGEWNDNSHWSDWNALYGSRGDWGQYKNAWRVDDDYRLTVTVKSGDALIEGAKVTWGNSGSAITNNKGVAYLFGTEPSGDVTVTCGDKSTSAQVDWVLNEHDLTYTAELESAVSPIQKKLDFMIMCDTTGSMGDELEYLKVELEDIVKSIKSQNSNIPTRVSVNFYRDCEDDYEVRQFPFSEDIDEVVEAIREQSANGGGDFPEAVHTALDSAVNKHDWSEDSVKIMFLVLDAPPHDDVQIIDSVNKYVAKAAEMGIRIVPIASSGIDKSTEYLLRSMAFTTGGTYTFLTDDSGVGGGHIEPTVGAYNVEKLNDMMIRIVNSYLK